VKNILRLGAVLGAVLMMTTPNAQSPGDRPAPNPRATRSAVMAPSAMVATSQPLASAAALQVFAEGGNAIDAAVTAAAVLSVVEPTMNGLGGDLFAIVFDERERKLLGLNASGRAPAAATLDEYRRRGIESVPGDGILSVTVPGVVDGWAELLERCGTIQLGRALAPAIAYARKGFPVSEIIAHQWQEVADRLAADPAAARTFLPGGRAPRPGDVFRNPDLADTLELIARGGRDAFYRGPVASAIVNDSQARGGLLSDKDFAAHRSDWVEPITTSYRGYDVYGLPPNTQGITVLQMLNILEGYDLKELGHNTAETLHLVVEAKRMAFADRDAVLADPDAVPPEVLRTLLSKEYALQRRGEISMERAAQSYAAGVPRATAPMVEGRDRGDTIYLTAADGRGNVVSLIQSIYSNFGAGIVAGRTGIALHNRGSLFSLDQRHPNHLAPGKRPFHTIIPAMVLKEGRPWLSYGVMGGDMQPQGHVQVLINLIDFGMNVQEAGEAPRVRHAAAGVALESSISAEARFGLSRRGHRLTAGVGVFGGYQGIMIDPVTGMLFGGSDPRKDGLAIGF
jgi:gamma-glutamyltranspeptidase / glutathione hydrolase